MAQTLSNPDLVRGPSRRASSWYPSLIASVVLAFLAGIVGTFAVFRWGADIGLDELLFSTDGLATGYVRSGSTGDEAKLQEYATVVQEVSSVLIPLYSREQTAENLQNIYPPDALTGWAVMLSQDGIAVTTVESLPSDDVVAQAEDGKPQAIDIIYRDVLTGVVFFSIARNGGTIANLEDPSQTAVLGENVISLQRALSGNPDDVREHEIFSFNGIAGRTDALAHSSEEVRSILKVSIEGEIPPGTPLINRRGRIVGLVRRNGEATEAIQSSEIIRLLPMVLARTQTQLPYFGISYVDLSEDERYAEELQLTLKSGAYLYRQLGSPIAKGSPASEADFKEKDVITKVGDKQLTESFSLADAIAELAPGDEVVITYQRDGTELTTTVTIGART